MSFDNGTVHVVEFRRPYDTNIHARRWYVWHEYMDDRCGRVCDGGAEFEHMAAADHYARALRDYHCADDVITYSAEFRRIDHDKCCRSCNTRCDLYDAVMAAGVAKDVYCDDYDGMAKTRKIDDTH